MECNRCLFNSFYNEYCATCKGEYFREDVSAEEVKALRHFKDSAVGLWCTDKPELVPDKTLFFQLSYDVASPGEQEFPGDLCAPRPITDLSGTIKLNDGWDL